MIDRIERQGLKGEPQDEGAATYDRKLSKEERRIDWARPASEIQRLVRGCLASEPAWCLCRGRRFEVLRAEWDPSAESGGPGLVMADFPRFTVGTGGGVIRIEEMDIRPSSPSLWPFGGHGLRKGAGLE